MFVLLVPLWDVQLMSSDFLQKNCKQTVDKYVEYDAVLVIVDLVLQYGTAYRHLMYNRTIPVCSKI